MIKKTTIIHWRIPFSFFLMPVFWLAWSLSPQADTMATIAAFIAIHLCLYPASNAFNSYYDKDEGSIGGIENPPPVDGELLWTSLVLDIIALLVAWWVSMGFALAMLLYGLISKAYSHDAIRLKKYPVFGWLTVGFFQGAFAYLMIYAAINRVSWDELQGAVVWWPAVLSSIMLLGSYPMTQIYQHKEDAKRGDKTISLKLGIRGTFVFTGVVFAVAMAGFGYFYTTTFSWMHSLAFAIALSPTLFFFLYWAFKSFNDTSKADFKSTMRLNLISACCTNAFYIAFGIWEYW